MDTVLLVLALVLALVLILVLILIPPSSPSLFPSLPEMTTNEIAISASLAETTRHASRARRTENRETRSQLPTIALRVPAQRTQISLPLHRSPSAAAESEPKRCQRRRRPRPRPLPRLGPHTYTLAQFASHGPALHRDDPKAPAQQVQLQPCGSVNENSGCAPVPAPTPQLITTTPPPPQFPSRGSIPSRGDTNVPPRRAPSRGDATATWRADARIPIPLPRSDEHGSIFPDEDGRTVLVFDSPPPPLPRAPLPAAPNHRCALTSVAPL
ncbi:hypothetical protein BC834DRAFT_892985 [Gloeopeniophorella convolvens]|nr:hypothetical protein BC834DRAFT_892985 [Gloeopeniophorella convolvens]